MLKKTVCVPHHKIKESARNIPADSKGDDECINGRPVLGRPLRKERLKNFGYTYFIMHFEVCKGE